MAISLMLPYLEAPSKKIAFHLKLPLREALDDVIGKPSAVHTGKGEIACFVTWPSRAHIAAKQIPSIRYPLV
ncbi:hypothetical protein QE369_002037 [Agrobacterium larrymoorei]|uniref:Uncharacterized protein n=1 Tax=Agrobacterium larrymoorei TaxID=160699 RepID=A0AAJ2BLL4_9HYPH|nr:hypothetical protein [Agrobacterium larrymoorei]